ncbi:unnamed protein product [Clonostachys solani]|uniref:Uncharacterized protein n=1 Tax=Clonostachys solani TaxID=160281 RepID=A0A9N9Z2U6_9HYPO|nr:unnamed protein product [Clonostachys solani]
MALKEEFKTLADDTSAISASNAAARPSKDGVAGKLVAITQGGEEAARSMLEKLPLGRFAVVEGMCTIRKDPHIGRPTRAVARTTEDVANADEWANCVYHRPNDIEGRDERRGPAGRTLEAAGPTTTTIMR